MDIQELWDKFAQDGRIEDYLEYRRHLEMTAQMDLGRTDDAKRTRLGDKGNGCW